MRKCYLSWVTSMSVNKVVGLWVVLVVAIGLAQVLQAKGTLSQLSDAQRDCAQVKSLEKLNKTSEKRARSDKKWMWSGSQKAMTQGHLSHAWTYPKVLGHL